MKMTPDTQKKAIAVFAFVLLAAGILYYQLSDTAGTPAPRPVSPTPVQTTVPSRQRTTGVARNVGSASTQLDPTLHMKAMLVAERLVYSGTGRNIFSAASAPVDIPKPIAPVRPKTTGAPVYTPPPGPPPPPPIDLKFFGTETTSAGNRKAFLLHGEDVFLAADGDIVQRRYKIITVSANSVLVEDMANNNRQSLPLIAR
jgi:hypothetical protein